MATYKCDRCSELTDTPVEIIEREPYVMGESMVYQNTIYRLCPCGGECVRIHVCQECREREAHDGMDSCLECATDAVVRDPREIEGCSRALQVEICKTLATRLACGKQLAEVAA